MSVAEEVVACFTASGATVAVAESLTGGLLTSALVDVPSASNVVRGGVVAYQTELKAELLGVDPELLATAGAVDPRVAQQMASGVAERLGADIGVATTGVAGPDPQDGRAVGTVFIAVASADSRRVEELSFTGDRQTIRRKSVDAALTLLRDTGPERRGNDNMTPM